MAPIIPLKDQKQIFYEVGIKISLSSILALLASYISTVTYFPFYHWPQDLCLIFLLHKLPGATLECLCLIQHHILPFNPLEILHILDYKLITGDHHVERSILSIQSLLQSRKQHLSHINWIDSPHAWKSNMCVQQTPMSLFTESPMSLQAYCAGQRGHEGQNECWSNRWMREREHGHSWVITHSCEHSYPTSCFLHCQHSACLFAHVPTAFKGNILERGW